MRQTPVIPATYEQWRECITVRCDIPLTESYTRSRLAEIPNKRHPKTIEFMHRCGEPH